MYKTYKERFTLTRPKTSKGEADYYTYLKQVNDNPIEAWHARNSLGKTMTFQALREKGLIETIEGMYCITDNGKWYIKIVESSNKVNPEVLRCILN